MIFVTGDLHGDHDIGKLSSDHWKTQKGLTRNDYLIIAGDFGLVWNGNRNEQYWRKWLNDKPFTALFVDGNHENFDRLEQYDIEKFSGGKVHKIEDNIYHLMRGQVFTLDGKKIFTMGGASSHDKEFRTPYISWWPQELPNYFEEQEAIDNLDKADWSVDCVYHTLRP